jgi:hypothetical protein
MDSQLHNSWWGEVAAGWNDAKTARAERRNAKLALEAFKFIMYSRSGETATEENDSHVSETLGRVVSEITATTSEIDGYTVGGGPTKSRAILH